jgi:hypothetical protein
MDSVSSADELWRRLKGESKEQIREDIAEKLGSSVPIMPNMSLFTP